jgi:hypothetical protein
MQFRIVLLLAALCLFVMPSTAQELTTREAEAAKDATNPKTGKPQSPLETVVEKQFGPDFRVDSKFPPMIADFDADGREDIAIIGFSKHPLGGSAGFKYTVVDPYDSYFGIGDPKITTNLAGFSDGSKHCILIIHDWKGEAPKSKWVIVNVPFTKVAPGLVTLKKKSVPAVATVELDGLSSLVFFDGKKYRWEPNEFDDGSDDMGP